jgi:hypothetical protein
MPTLRPARTANPFPSLFNISVLQDPQPLENSGASDDIDMDKPAAYAATVLAVIRPTHNVSALALTAASNDITTFGRGVWEIDSGQR